MVVSCRYSYPVWIFDKVASTGALVDSLRVDPLIYGSLGLPDDLSELRILWELVPVRFPRRVSSVPIQERLSLPAASWTVGRYADHGARCAPECAPRAGGLRGAEAKVTWVSKRRDKRTRLVHDLVGRREMNVSTRKEMKKEVRGRNIREKNKDDRTVVFLASSGAGNQGNMGKRKSDDCQLPRRGGTKRMFWYMTNQDSKLSVSHLISCVDWTQSSRPSDDTWERS